MDTSRDLQTHNDGDELRRHDLTVYFIRHQVECEQFVTELHQQETEEQERKVVERWWNELCRSSQ